MVDFVHQMTAADPFERLVLAAPKSYIDKKVQKTEVHFSSTYSNEKLTLVEETASIPNAEIVLVVS